MVNGDAVECRRNGKSSSGRAGSAMAERKSSTTAMIVVRVRGGSYGRRGAIGEESGESDGRPQWLRVDRRT